MILSTHCLTDPLLPHPPSPASFPPCSSSGADANQEGAPSPGTVASRAATFNTTAQRYAAYRLRAAQSKQSPNERKWVR